MSGVLPEGFVPFCKERAETSVGARMAADL
jgi:hypothetical protein